MQNLFEILDSRKIFKLVLALGNQSYDEIKELSRIYALAGADMFDVNPSEEAIYAVRDGIKEAGLNAGDFMICLSAGLEGDIHIQKAKINTKKCIRCMECVKTCPQDAISAGQDGKPAVNAEKCIGCEKCKKCPAGAIDFAGIGSNLENVVKLADKYNVECVELHVSTQKTPVKEIKYLVKNIKCPLSLCLDRRYYSNEKIKGLITEVKKITPKFIIQADGVPMSGGEDSFESTLQAVAMVHLVQEFGMYILISGGTNSKTAELANMCNVKFHGISVGSYARQIVKEKPFGVCLQEAKSLVAACKSSMGLGN